MCSSPDDITLLVTVDTTDQVAEAHEENNIGSLHGLSFNASLCPGMGPTQFCVCRAKIMREQVFEKSCLPGYVATASCSSS